MKPYLLTFFVMLVLGNLCRAQNLNEWLRQKRTQKKYLEKQIAELKIYLELTEKGYKIAKQGLETIGQIKEGEFKLHHNYFDTLRIVSKTVRASPRLRQITDLHKALNSICEKLPAVVSAYGLLNSAQLSYITWVLKAVYDDGQSVMVSFLAVISDQNLSMSDYQRLDQIENYYNQMLSNYEFASSFQSNALTLCRQLEVESSQINTTRSFHGLK